MCMVTSNMNALLQIKVKKTHEQAVLFGVDHKLHKQVLTYIEGAYARTKTNDKGKTEKTEKEKSVGVGLRVYF